MNKQIIELTTKTDNLPAPLFNDLTPKGEEYEYINPKELLAVNMLSMLQEIQNKITKGRIKDKETEKIKIEYLKTYINGVNAYSNLTKQNQYRYNPSELTAVLHNDNTNDGANAGQSQHP